MAAPRRFPIVLIAFAAMSSAPASADWIASGVFLYQDREYDDSGFTGAEPVLPVRLADIEVIDANASGRGALLASGATALDGSFSILVPDTLTRSVYVRAITRSDSTADLNIDVRQTTAAKAVYYASATTTIPGHAPTINVDFGTAVVPIGQGGEAFNLYDQLLRGVDYLAFLNGSRPDADSHLAAVWSFTNGVGDSHYEFGSRFIVMRDSGGYDDTVVLHEMGHYALREYSATNTAGGFHTFSLCNVEIRLAYDEGFATFWGNSVLRYHQMPACNIYMRSNGGPGPGNLVRMADLETDTLYQCRGATNEVNVFTVMWDIVDGASTPDTTPGVDDAHDLMDRPDADLWEVMTGYMVSGATTRTIEDFWDGWFLPPASNGFKPEMIDIADYVGIEYVEDAFEVNDQAGQSTGVTINASPLPATFFRDPDGDGAGAADTDYFSFSTAAGEPLIIETRDILSDGDTYLRLYDSDATTLLVFNDNRATGDKSSRIDWTPPHPGVFYAQITHTTGNAVYGAYDFSVSTLNPTDADNDGFNPPDDCNDADPTIHPGASELCDGVDQDCDGVTDNGFDVDGDGFTLCAADCDDADASINPFAIEILGNGIDDNCNGLIDESQGGRRIIYDIPIL